MTGGNMLGNHDNDDNNNDENLQVCGCLPVPPESHGGDLRPANIEYLCPDNKRLP